MHPRTAILCFTPLSAVIASGAFAQRPSQLGAPSRPEPTQTLVELFNQQDAIQRQTFLESTPLSERILLDVGGSFRFGQNYIDDAFGNTSQLQQYDSRWYARAELDGVHRFYGRLRLWYNVWESDDGASAPPNEDGWTVPIGELYWYELDLGGAMANSGKRRSDLDLKLRGGRQYIVWGQGLTLSTYMYAGTFDWTIGQINIQGLAGVTAGNDTVDFDTSRPGYDTDTDRAYYGLKAEWRRGQDLVPYCFALLQQDGNAGQTDVLLDGLAPGGGGYPTEFDYESQYYGIGATGSLGRSWQWRAEAVYETGTTLSSSISPTGDVLPQVEDDISAWAGVVGLQRAFDDRAQTRFDLQSIVGSGDAGRLDSGNTLGGPQPGQVDKEFNSNGFLYTGYVLSPSPANLWINSVGLSGNWLSQWRAFRDMRFGLTGFTYLRLDPEAPITAFVDKGGSNWVGWELDASIDWRIMSDVNLQFLYGAFFPNDEIFPDNQDDARHFIYGGVTYAF
ncbi:MAG: hypothetical protein FJ252_07175 [Phycisphaerae bacterium]|nr:hypothetical protein [Phycisphaerae bacterium]